MDILLYKLLISSQLSGVIAAYALVVVGCLVLVECVGREVEHTVVKALVLEYLLVCLCHWLWKVADLSIDKHRVIEITLVHLPEVDEAEDSHQGCCAYRIYLLHAEGQKHGCAYCYHPERAPAVCREHGTPDFPQILKKRLELVLRELAEGVQLGLGDKAREEH